MMISKEGAKPIEKSVKSVKLLHGCFSKEKIRKNLREKRQRR